MQTRQVHILRQHCLNRLLSRVVDSDMPHLRRLIHMRHLDAQRVESAFVRAVYRLCDHRMAYDDVRAIGSPHIEWDVSLAVVVQPQRCVQATLYCYFCCCC